MGSGAAHGYPVVLSDLSIEYPPRGASAAHVALHGVSLRLGPGEVLGLLGSAGSGKSTLARVLSGVAFEAGADARPVITGGDAVVLGTPLRGIPRRKLHEVRFHGSLAVTSATVNLAVKPIPRRRRPSITDSVRTHGVRMPGSHSWPSGHTASAFAFATGAGGELPELDSALRLAATVVAYSRVHTGVHYPGDVVAGALIGAGVGSLAHSVVRRVR